MSDSEMECTKNDKTRDYIPLDENDENDEDLDFTGVNGWGTWLNDNSERLKYAGYVFCGLSAGFVGGYFLYKKYSNDE